MFYFSVRRAGALTMGLLIVAGTLAGCAAKNSIVGKWSATQTTPQGTANVVMEFKADGTNTATSQGNVTFGGQSRNISITTNGTYKAEGTTLTETVTSMSSNLMPGAAGQDNNINPTHKATAVTYKIDGDTLTLTSGKSPKPLILTRVKG